MAQGSWGGSGDTRVFRVNIQFRHAAQNCQTGFHIRDVGINTLQAEDVANAVLPWVTTKFIHTLNTADIVTGIDVVNLATHEGFALSPSGIAGSVVGTPGPAFITVPVSIKGSIRRRYGNGRMLWPVGDQASVVGNSLAPGALAGHQDAAADLADRFMDDGITATMRLVHLHPLIVRPDPANNVPATWYDATSLRVSSAVSSLRRRKAGHGS